MKVCGFNMIKYIKANWWRFTPDSWLDWAYYLWVNIKHKYYFNRIWGVKPWHNNIRCASCAGSGIRTKYDFTDICYDCDGKGYILRYNETKISKIFKFFGIRKNNIPIKLY